MASSILTVEGVTKTYSSAAGTGGLTVLKDVSLTVQSGESLAIMGPSGSGKSTLLQIIGTLDKPSSGKITLEGRDLALLKDDEVAAVRNRQIGFIFQSHYLLPQCTVWENVLVPTLASGSAKANALEASATGTERPEQRAERLLKRVGLGARLGHKPGQLSGGERQRVAVVRALINKPQLLLADEPTGSLDHASAVALGQLLAELNREEGVTLIVATHSPELAARMNKTFELRDAALVPLTRG